MASACSGSRAPHALRCGWATTWRAAWRPWQHAHDFAVDRHATERRVWAVVAISVAMRMAEIGAGWWWNSMALLADGWHMGTHAAAIGVTGISYWLTRR